MDIALVEFTNKILDFGQFLNHSKTFVETGTCHGRTVQIALDKGYERVFSVEVHEPFFEMCRKRFKDVPNVHLWHDKSTHALESMLRGADEACVIFLDAHPTGPNSGGHDDLMEKGDKSEFHQDSILKGELEIILAHRKDHIIIIDDQNGLNPVSSAHIKQIAEANPKYEFSFYDEGEGEHFYKNKSVVCIPKI